MVRHTESEGTRFQYQKGAIKTVGLHDVAVNLQHFNTKKVRLKLGRSSDRLGVRNHVFQYQKGAIKTYPPAFPD